MIADDTCVMSESGMEPGPLYIYTLSSIASGNLLCIDDTLIHMRDDIRLHITPRAVRFSYLLGKNDLEAKTRLSPYMKI